VNRGDAKVDIRDMHWLQANPKGIAVVLRQSSALRRLRIELLNRGAAQAGPPDRAIRGCKRRRAAAAAAVLRI